MSRSNFPFRPPQPPDVLQILQDVKQLQIDLAADTAKAIAELSRQFAELAQLLTDQTEHFDARLDKIDAADTQIEADLNPAIPPVLPVVYRSATTMAIVTSINLTAGGASDGVQFEDSSSPPQVFPGSQVTWSLPVGEANASDLGVTLNSDGVTFTFLAPSSAPTESVTLFATWTDPTGIQPAIVGSPLTVNITGAVVNPTFVAPGQYNEVNGS
jgi:uncharacterized coiled-coil protein SlyX